MHLHITVKAGSRQNEFIVNADGSIKVKIKAVAVEGKANEELVNFLSKVFNLPKKLISLEKGKTSIHKKISFDAEREYIMNVLKRNSE